MNNLLIVSLLYAITVVSSLAHLIFLIFFEIKGEGHPEIVPPPVVIKSMTRDTDHELQGSKSLGA